MYVAIEALADGGVKMGLPRPMAMKLASQMVMVGVALVVKRLLYTSLLRSRWNSDKDCATLRAYNHKRLYIEVSLSCSTHTHSCRLPYVLFHFYHGINSSGFPMIFFYNICLFYIPHIFAYMTASL